MSALADDTAGSLAGEVFKRAAQVQTQAVVICECAGVPLNELQQTALTQAIIECFDGITATLAMTLTADAHLRTGNIARLLGTPDA